MSNVLITLLVPSLRLGIESIDISINLQALPTIKKTKGKFYATASSH